MSEGKTSSETLPKLTSQDLEVISTCLDFAKELFSTEKERRESIAARGTNLLGFAGIIAALTIDTIGLIESVRLRSYKFSLLMGIVYIFMLLAIFVTIWLAFGIRRPSVTARPKVDDIFEFQRLNNLEAKRRWLSALVSAYKITLADVNRKVTYLRYAQGSLFIAVIFLLLVVALGVIAIVLP